MKPIPKRASTCCRISWMWEIAGKYFKNSRYKLAQHTQLGKAQGFRERRAERSEGHDLTWWLSSSNVTVLSTFFSTNHSTTSLSQMQKVARLGWFERRPQVELLLVFKYLETAFIARYGLLLYFKKAHSQLPPTLIFYAMDETYSDATLRGVVEVDGKRRQYSFSNSVAWS